MEMTNVGNLLELRRIYSRGITGKGITTAVLDTGIYAHPDFLFHRIKFFISGFEFLTNTISVLIFVYFNKSSHKSATDENSQFI